MVTGQLICTFVSAYAKRRFPHDVTEIGPKFERWKSITVHCNLIITISLGFVEKDRVISEFNSSIKRLLQ